MLFYFLLLYYYFKKQSILLQKDIMLIYIIIYLPVGPLVHILNQAKKAKLSKNQSLYCTHLHFMCLKLAIDTCLQLNSSLSIVFYCPISIIQFIAPALAVLLKLHQLFCFCFVEGKTLLGWQPLIDQPQRIAMQSVIFLFKHALPSLYCDTVGWLQVSMSLVIWKKDLY